MANITMRLKTVIDITDGDFGLSRYPIFDESYREQLNQKIIDRYYNREIAHESIEMFKLSLHRKMNEIMPLKNKMYESELLKFDPFVTVDMIVETESKAGQTTEGEGSSTQNSTSERESDTTNAADGNSSSDSTSRSEGRTINSEFPQQMLSGSGDYATSGTDATTTNTAAATAEESNASTSSTGETGSAASTAEDVSKSVMSADGEGVTKSKGFTGNRALLLADYRATLLNIDLEIVEEVGQCFMFLLSTPEPFFRDNPFGYNY